MTMLIPAIYEHGNLILTENLDLPEHQKVLLAIAITQDNIPAYLISKFAEESQNFQFLKNTAEDIYSSTDGEAV